MVPPIDNPRKLRNKKFNSQIIAELEDLGIIDDLFNFIRDNPNATIPEIQRYSAEKHSYPDIGYAEIEHLKHGYYHPQVGNGRGANKGRRKNHKTIEETLIDDFGITNNEGDE